MKMAVGDAETMRACGRPARQWRVVPSECVMEIWRERFHLFIESDAKCSRRHGDGGWSGAVSEFIRTASFPVARIESSVELFTKIAIDAVLEIFQHWCR